MQEIIKKRTLHVTGMSCEGCETTINLNLGKADGVKTVKADKKGTVYVEYDLMKTNLKKIENIFLELGYAPSATVFQKIKRGLINYTEENEYDNMTIPAGHHCSACGSGDSCEIKHKQ